MKYRFYDSNIITCYIKEFLHSFNLPKVQVYTKELEEVIDYQDGTSSKNSLYDGKVYIKDDQIVKYNNGEFNKIARYIYNYPMLNFTKRFIIKSSDYDQYTHRYLGEYLRFLRDYKKIDLMCLYNCFSLEEPGRIVLIDKNDREGIQITDNFRLNINTDDENYNYFVVPVKFDKTYTIALNANIKYDIVCLLHNNVFVSHTPDELIKESYMNVDGSLFSQPYTYSTKFNCTHDYKLWKQEKDLRMLIRLPKMVESSIVVLEGNFVNGSNIIDGGLNGKYKVNVSEDPLWYASKLSLLELNDGNSYPFADRLIEFLLKQAITSDDYINKNIEYTQDMVYRNKTMQGIYGVWNNRLRYDIYKNTLEQDITRGKDKKYSNTIISYDNDDREDIYSFESITNSSEGTKCTVKASYWFNAKNLADNITGSDGEITKGVRKPLGDNSQYILTGEDVLTIKYEIDGKEIGTYKYGVEDGFSYLIINYLNEQMVNEDSLTTSSESDGWHPIGVFDGDTLVDDTPRIIIIKVPENGKKVKSFIDIYSDITGFVDKDTETLLRLKNGY